MKKIMPVKDLNTTNTPNIGNAQGGERGRCQQGGANAGSKSDHQQLSVRGRM